MKARGIARDHEVLPGMYKEYLGFDQRLGEQLVEDASGLYGMAKDVIDDDNEVIGRFVTVAKSLAEAQDPILVKLLPFVTSTDGKLLALSLARWCHYGFPQVVMPHTYAAGLLVSKADVESVEKVRPPWPAFMIVIPNGLIYMHNPEEPGELLELTRMIVATHATSTMREGWAWTYTALAETRTALYKFGVRASEMIEGWCTDDKPEEIPGKGPRVQDTPIDPMHFEISDYDKRSFSLLGRLVINTCLAMSDPTRVRAPSTKQQRPKVSVKGRAGALPKVRTYSLGQPLKHDFRDTVRTFARGERKQLTVQGMVAGHFKMQPHGPRNTLRKLIWREPFWRGPEDAPLLVRSHVIGEEG